MMGTSNAANNYVIEVSDLDSLTVGDGIVYAVNTGANNLSGWLVSCGVFLHATLTYDGTTARLYVNGMQVKNSAAATLGANPTNIVLGALRTGAATPTSGLFRGILSRMAYYTSALPQATITAHAAAAFS